MRHIRRRWAFGCGVLLWAVCSCAGENPAEAGRLTQDLLFYQGFDAGGVAHLQGHLGHRFILDPRFVVEGQHGRGYRFEPPYENLLPAGQASPAAGAGGFVAGSGVTLRVNAGQPFRESAVLSANGTTGLLWQTAPVELSNVSSPHQNAKSFLGSVYLRASLPGVKVRLEVADEAETNEWRGPIREANDAALKKDPKAKVTEPVDTRSQAGEVELTAEWQRVTAQLSVDVRRPVQRLRLRLTLVGPSPAEVDAAALQMEQCQKYPHYRNYAGPWIPGGEKHAGHALRMPLNRTGFTGAAGTLACWVRLPAPEGGGSRGGTVMTLGGGWWKPVWTIGSGPCYLGDAGREGYKNGRSLVPFPGVKQKALGDGAWHHLAATWGQDVCALYMDGEEIGRADYLAAQPGETAALVLGASTLEGDHAAAFVDEIAVWGRALDAGEIRESAQSGTPLATLVPALLLERPVRTIFHRGEETARLKLEMVSSQGERASVKATVSAPGLGISEVLKLRPGRPGWVVVRPWRAEAGRYPLTVRSDDGVLKAEVELEIVASLPTTDFSMLGWTSGPEPHQFGLTTEVCDGTLLPAAMRRGMLACLRFDARAWHPLAPETYAASLDSARVAARQAAHYPNVFSCMINTEVGAPAPPQASWFLDRMRRETGLAAVPGNVRFSPLLVVGATNSPALIPEGDPEYRFMRWFIAEGKGWPRLHREVAAIMRQEGLQNTLFYTDQPETAADLQGLDMGDYWGYPHVSSGLVTHFNRVCGITRLAGKKTSLMPGTIFWDPWPFRVDDKVVNLSPDLTRQYLWIAAANPLDHLGLYGFGELAKHFVPPGMTNVLRETLAAVYPIGLLTGGLPAGPVPVAYLHTEGQWWQGPGDNAWIEYWFNRRATRALAEARLRFDTIGDDHVEAGWLKDYAAVIMPGAWRVPERTHRALVKYAAAGGEVVIDRRCRAVIPNATVLEVANRGPQPKTVDALQQWARAFQARHPEALRVRAEDEAWLFDKTDGAARFIFVVNDRMQPGLLGIDHRLAADLGTTNGPVRDQGQAQTVKLKLAREAGAAIYDVRRHQRLAADGPDVDVALAPGDAAVLAVVPEPVARIELDVPSRLRAGDSASLRVSVLTASGRPVKHRDLLEITVTDATGKRVDMPRYQRVTNGRVDIPLRLALTTPPGKLVMAVQEWIAGCRSTVEGEVLQAAQEAIASPGGAEIPLVPR